jgi:hypothetical protein
MIGIVHRFGGFSRFTSSRNIVGIAGRWYSSISSRISSDKSGSGLGTCRLGETGGLGINRCGGRITFGNLGSDLGSGLTVDGWTLNDGLVLGVLSSSIRYIGKVASDGITTSSGVGYVGESCSVRSRRSGISPRGTLGDDRWSTWALLNSLLSAHTLYQES